MLLNVLAFVSIICWIEKLNWSNRLHRHRHGDHRVRCLLRDLPQGEGDGRHGLPTRHRYDHWLCHVLAIVVIPWVTTFCFRFGLIAANTFFHPQTNMPIIATKRVTHTVWMEPMARKWRKRENLQRKDIRADKKPKGSAKRTIFSSKSRFWAIDKW